MTPRKLTAEQRADIRRKFKAGARIRTLTVEYLVGNSTIRAALNEEGPMPRPLSESQKRQLARMRGEYTDPPPVVTKSVSRFCGRIAKKTEEPSIRTKTGSPTR